MSQLKEWAREVLEVEIQALQGLTERLDDQFEEAVKALLGSQTKLAVLGMGKSGLIGRKIAATLSSTGTASYFVHPAEAIHGDLGMISPGDFILAISQSGETNEILQLLPFFRENHHPLIAFTGNPHSTLARQATWTLSTQVTQEACPLDLAPTSSSTAQLVMGDALAIALMKAKDFQQEEFARFHPGGSLGKRLVTTVEEVMRRDELPTLGQDSPLPEVIYAISKGRLGLVIVLDEEENIAGIITDGDLRRAMETFRERFFIMEAQQVMTPNPKQVRPNRKLVEAEFLMLHHKINSLLVVEDKKLKGVIQIYQIPL